LANKIARKHNVFDMDMYIDEVSRQLKDHRAESKIVEDPSAFDKPVRTYSLTYPFCGEKPNQKRVTDVTEFSLFGEKLYLSPILDLCSSDLVSYTISTRPVLSMVTSMLDNAVIENFFGLLKSELL